MLFLKRAEHRVLPYLVGEQVVPIHVRTIGNDQQHETLAALREATQHLKAAHILSQDLLAVFQFPIGEKLVDLVQDDKKRLPSSGLLLPELKQLEELLTETLF